MFRKILGAVVAGAAMMTAMPVKATTYIITYTGHVSSGRDFSGLFGAPNTDLSGLAYKSVYTLEYPLPGAIAYSDGIKTSTKGGSYYGTPTPMSAVFTLKNTNIYFTGSNLSESFNINGLGNPYQYGYDQIWHLVNDHYGVVNNYSSNKYMLNYIFNNVNNITNVSGLPVSLDYTAGSSDFARGEFADYILDNVGGRFIYGASAILQPEHITIAPFSSGAVPEPSTWVMMIIGLGAVGGAMRGGVHRRERAAQL